MLVSFVWRFWLNMNPVYTGLLLILSVGLIRKFFDAPSLVATKVVFTDTTFVAPDTLSLVIQSGVLC